MRGNCAPALLGAFLGACGRSAQALLCFRRGLADGSVGPGTVTFIRFCGRRRRIKRAVSECAPEDCGALRYYKWLSVKQMRREGKGWWVLKRLGGEIEASNPRKRVKLAPAAASLVTFSFALLFSSSLLYAALFPGFSMPRRAAPHRPRTLFARSSATVRAKPLLPMGMSPLLTFRHLLRLRSRAFSLLRFRRPRRPFRKTNPSKRKILHRTIPLRARRRAALANRALRAGALLAQMVRTTRPTGRAVPRRRQALRLLKKMSSTRFSWANLINASSFRAVCVNRRGI